MTCVRNLWLTTNYLRKANSCSKCKEHVLAHCPHKGVGLADSFIQSVEKPEANVSPNL